MKPHLIESVAAVAGAAGLGQSFWLVLARMAHDSPATPRWWTSMASAALLVAACLLVRVGQSERRDGEGDWRDRWTSRASWITSVGGALLAMFCLAVAGDQRDLQLLAGPLVMLTALAALVTAASAPMGAGEPPSWLFRVFVPLQALTAGAMVMNATFATTGAAPVMVYVAVSMLWITGVMAVALLLRTRASDRVEAALGDAGVAQWSRFHAAGSAAGRAVAPPLLRPARRVVLPWPLHHQRTAWLLAYLLPLVLMIVQLRDWFPGRLAALLAMVCCLAGLLIEQAGAAARRAPVVEDEEPVAAAAPLAPH